MAVNPNTGLTSGPPKPAKKKPVAKKPVVGKKKPKPTLRPEYNLVFDPTGQQSELLQGELDAIRDLYLSSAGRNIEEEPDKRVALEQAGLLKPTVSKKKASELKRGGSDEFASAMDAPIRIANANEQTDAVIESAEAGRSPSDLNDLIGKSNPFSPMGELSMKGLAAENGWDTADWDKLTVGDKAFRAANNNDYWGFVLAFCSSWYWRDGCCAGWH
jgi:hypothetical protein